MKTYIILILVFLSTAAIAAPAQVTGNKADSLSLKFTGKVIDSVTKEPLIYAQVVINAGQKLVMQALTDTMGRFEASLKEGTYQVKVFYMGNENQVFNLVIAANSDHAVNRVFNVKIKTELLNEVSVYAKRKIIENTAEKIVYHVDRDPMAKNKSLSEVIKKVPLITVDFKGVPSLKGSEKVQVQVNGRSVTDYAIPVDQALKMIPTANVESVEVITSPGAASDGESLAGIINIITKNKLSLGGNLTVGVESTIGKSYNTKPTLNFTYGVGKVNFSLNGSYTNFKTLGFSNQLYSRNNFLQAQGGDLGYNGNPVYVNSGLFYQINKNQSLNAGLTAANSPYTFNQNLQTNINDQGTVNIFNRFSDNSVKATSLSTNLDYKFKFDKPGKEFNVGALFTTGKQNNLNNSINNYVSGTGSPMLQELSSNNNTIRTVIIQSDYKLPIGKHKLQAGIKLTNRHFDSKYQNAVSNQLAASSATADEYAYNQGVYAAFGQFQLMLPKKWTMIGGARYERTQNDARFISTNSSVNQGFNSFLPTYVIGKNLKNGMISLTYSYKISRPGISYLNPFQNFVNANTVAQGNPDLLPEHKNGLTLAFSHNAGKAYLYVDASADFWSDYILRVNQFVNNINQITYKNIGSYRQFGTSANLNLSITKALGLTVGGTLNLISTSDAAFNATYNEKLNFNASFIGTYNFKGGYNLQAEYYLYSNNYFFQSKTQLPNTSSIGLNKSFMKDRINLSVGVINPLNNKIAYDMLNINGGLTNQNIQTVYGRGLSFGFSYQFGNDKVNKKSKTNIKDNDTKEGSTNPIGF
ncbi:outer membrane beta-barrel family protein [Pedobacter sp. SG918]|uniref:outer membrane beta-barrel family protein n=1 Tax=Pedobacter sp. SG918 TaxID=2587136 RepID=UPI00146BC10C|nr:outer membrane beta-barrel family protein [Pedobacter sp. SG918]NMN38845.1 outer membrane receptor protein involved in Fe transport [Pedobacter sp. SG918]